MTSHGRRPPPTAARLATGAPGRGVVAPPSSYGARPITGAVQDGAARPMTAVRAAGYTSSGHRGKSICVVSNVDVWVLVVSSKGPFC